MQGDAGGQKGNRANENQRNEQAQVRDQESRDPLREKEKGDIGQVEWDRDRAVDNSDPLEQVFARAQEEKKKPNA